MQVTGLAGTEQQKTGRALPVLCLVLFNRGPVAILQEQGLDQNLQDCAHIGVREVLFAQRALDRVRDCQAHQCVVIGDARLVARLGSRLSQVREHELLDFPDGRATYQRIVYERDQLRSGRLCTLFEQVLQNFW